MRQPPYRSICDVHPLKFWRHVEISSDTNACWLWRRKPERDGYCRYNPQRGVKYAAHQVAWVLWHESPVPTGLILRHSCDTRRCCNPMHLSPGTHAQNSADMISRDRQTRGEDQFHAKLTEADILAIRASHESQVALGRRYGVWSSTISDIVRRKTWKHL